MAEVGNMPLLEDGVLSDDELAKLKGVPSIERLAQGAVAVIECAQEIPCNPCEAACPQGAIQVGEPIINLPVLNEGDCTGCGLCIARCPGQAVFVVDMTYSEEEACVQLPYEFVPLPRKGDLVVGLNRRGEEVCSAQVVRVTNTARMDRTPVVTVAVPKDCAMDVRSIARKKV
jgi:Fe-S-cluster-containing hydrogenase component 2